MLACWGHDLIEDTRVSYNDVKGQLGEEAADIIYALTNEKVKTVKNEQTTNTTKVLETHQVRCLLSYVTELRTYNIQR